MLPTPGSISQVTPAWMTQALAKRFPGAVVSDLELSDVVDGTNRRASVSLRYAAGDGPTRVFVKMHGRALSRLALLALGALTTEARLFASGVQLPLEHALPYAAAFDPRRLSSIVVIEDVTLRGGEPNDATRPLTVEQARCGLGELARLHAACWERPLPPGLGFVSPWHLRGAWAPVSSASLAYGLRRLRAGEERAQPAHGGDARGPTGQWRLSIRALERQFRASAALASTGPQTLLHGDPHPGNSYALSGDRVGFYDWQLIRSGNWSHDVGYFLISSLDVTSRRAHERDLLGGYLETLGAEGVAAPSPDTAWERYRAAPAYGLGAWLHTFSAGSFQTESACRSTLERFAAAYDDLETATAAALDSAGTRFRER